MRLFFHDRPDNMTIAAKRAFCPPVRSIAAVLLFLALLPIGCDTEIQTEEASSVPLSAELSQSLLSSQRSLETGDGGDPQVKLDLDRYYGLKEMLFRPVQRETAEDSLFGLWKSDLEHPLWPDLAAFTWDLFRNHSDFDAMFYRPDFPDSSTVIGLYLREWLKLKTVPHGEDFRRAWDRRSQLGAFERTWLALRMSRQERLQGHADKAARIALDALSDARELGGWRFEMEVWFTVARALRVGDHLDDALHAIRMTEDLAAAVAQQTGNTYIVTFAGLEHAKILAARFEMEPAIQLYETCIDSAMANGVTTLAGIGLNWAGISTKGSGDYEKGLEYYRRSLAISIAAQDSLDIPRHLANIARRHRLLGDLDSCLVYLKEAERWIEAYPNPGNRAGLPRFQAEYYAQIGDFATVDSLLDAVSKLIPRFSPIEELAELHLQLIKQGMERGRPAQAYRSIAVLDSLSDRLVSRSPDRNELFDLRVASAEFLARQGLFAHAVEALDDAEAILARRPDPHRLWELSRVRGYLARRRDDPEAAEIAYRTCLAMSEELRDKDGLEESRLQLGTVLLDQGRYESALDLFTHRTEDAFGGRFRTRLSAILLAAVTETRAGNFDEALRFLGRARSLSKPSSPPDLLARLDLETGRAQAGLGNNREAQIFYKRVADRLKQERHRSALDARIYLDRSLRRELAEAMVVLAAEVPGSELHGKEAERLLRDLRTLIPEWQRTAARDAAALVNPQLIYFVGSEVSCRWDLTDEEVSLKILSGEVSLLEHLAPVIADLQQPTRDPVGKELDALTTTLGGAPPGWLEGSRLTIVPDGPLFSVPWSALPSGDDSNRAWIDQGPIVLADAPSIREGQTPSTREEFPKLLVLGVDREKGARDAGLLTLRHAEDEARDIYRLWPEDRASLRVGAEADWRALDPQELSDCGVIHIASHALVYQGQADKTTLMLAGSGGDPLTSAEIGQLDLSADLVFLSCCEAAEGIRRGIGPAHAGLARSFVAAGARAVVAPSMRIEDEAARHLAGRFYHHWLDGVSVEEALRRAQFDLRDGDPRWAHPYYWASYQAIGS